MKKFLSLALALLMVLTLCFTMLVACSEEEPGEEKPGTENPGEKPGDEKPGDEKPGEEEPGEDECDGNHIDANRDSKCDKCGAKMEPAEVVRIPLVFPEESYDFSYNGEKGQYHILQWSVDQQNEPGTDWIPWEEGAVEMDDGDLISKAILERNALAEEQFFVDITAEYVGVNAGYVNRVLQDFNAGSDEFQLLTIRSLDAWQLVSDGLLLDMNVYADEGILHTDQPWWVPDAVESYTLGPTLYVCATEMLLRDKGATTALYFNPTIAENYDLDDFYALVDEQAWTYDVMIEAAETVAHSEDGNDLMDSVEDLWGVYGSDDDTHMLFNAFGFSYAHIDEDGYIVYNLGEDIYAGEDINALISIHEDYHYAEWNTNRIDNKLVGNDDIDDLFTIDKALFKSASLVKTAVTKLRNMNTDYGILPMPKYEEEQENYSSLVWVHHDCVLGIPAGTGDPIKSAVVLESLSWEGYYSVTPVLYDTILYGRAAKTAEAKACLQLIFSTRSYDPGQYWDEPGGLQNELLRLCNNGTSDISSLIAQHIDKTREELKEVNKFVDQTYD